MGSKLGGSEGVLNLNVTPGQTSQLSVQTDGVGIVGQLSVSGNTVVNTLDALDGFISGRLGIGTSTPVAALEVVADENDVIVGRNTSEEGTKNGVSGLSSSSGGRGVFGWATAASGVTHGVSGISSSDDGIGVNGFASTGIGVAGSSIDFRGVYGSSIAGNGVYGQTSSESASGVIGYATANSGEATGVRGISDSPNGFGVFSFGNFGGTGAKYFVQPHPHDPAKEIRFVSLEGNESGTYFRGSGQLNEGRAYIKVPDEFRWVTEPKGLTIQLTPMGPDAGLWVESKSLDEIVVRGNYDVKFDYFVNGVRLGFRDLEIVGDNCQYRPTIADRPFGSHLRPQQRQLLVGNGVLNSDFTPSRSTASRLGWKLKSPLLRIPIHLPTNENDNRSPSMKIKTLTHGFFGLVVLAITILSTASVHAQTFSIEWYSIDSGGGFSSAEVLNLREPLANPTRGQQCPVDRFH